MSGEYVGKAQGDLYHLHPTMAPPSAGPPGDRWPLREGGAYRCRHHYPSLVRWQHGPSLVLPALRERPNQCVYKELLKEKGTRLMHLPNTAPKKTLFCRSLVKNVTFNALNVTSVVPPRHAKNLFFFRPYIKVRDSSIETTREATHLPRT